MQYCSRMTVIPQNNYSYLFEGRTGRQPTAAFLGRRWNVTFLLAICEDQVKISSQHQSYQIVAYYQ